MNNRDYVIEEKVMPGFMAETEPIVVPQNHFPHYSCPYTMESESFRYRETHRDLTAVHTIKVVDVEGHDNLKGAVCDTCGILLVLLRNPDTLKRNRSTDRVEKVERKEWGQWAEDAEIFSVIHQFVNPRFPVGFMTNHADESLQGSNPCEIYPAEPRPGHSTISYASGTISYEGGQ